MKERDFFRERLTEEELRALLKETAPFEAFAWRSPRAKGMGIDAKSPPPDNELLRLMLEVPYLVKRPVIRIGDQVIFGFDQKRIEATLAGLGDISPRRAGA